METLYCLIEESGCTCLQVYGEEFRADMRLAMKSAASAAGSAIYSSACFKHCVSLSTEFWTVMVNTAYAGRVSFSESLREWIEHDYQTGAIFDMEHCTGFNCGCRKAKGWKEVA